MVSTGNIKKNSDGSRSRPKILEVLIGKAARFVWSTPRDKTSEMHILNTLSLGGGRELFLVICMQQEYLVGAAYRSVGPIVRVDRFEAVTGNEPVLRKESL